MLTIKLNNLTLSGLLVALVAAFSSFSYAEDLNGCNWYTNQVQNSNTIKVYCPVYAKPISGGCWTNSNARLVNSTPIENDTGNNLPENEEHWDNLKNPTGWFCKRDAETGRMRATVLCCGIAPET